MNTLTGTGGKTGAGYFLAQTDFDGAIAACNAVIEKTPTADDYLIRAYARCFAKGKDTANYDKAIEDCSIALNMMGTNFTPKNGTALRIRALAYYLKGDCANALNDCAWVLDKPNAAYSDADDKLFVREIRAQIHFKTQNYERAIMDCREVIPTEDPVEPNIFPTLSVVEIYLGAQEKMQLGGA